MQLTLVLGISLLGGIQLTAAGISIQEKLGDGFNLLPWFKPDTARQKRSPGGGEQKFPETGRQPRGGAHSYSRSPTTECGVQSRPFVPPLYHRVPRILNGTCTPYGAFPWTVQIQIKKNGRFEHHCGGTIISEFHILTARHCFGSARDVELMKVVVGQDNLHSQESSEMHFQIDKAWLHSQYQSEGPYSHDIAIIRIRPKGDGIGIRFSSDVSPICLPDASDKLEDNLKCVISGWGKRGTSGKIQSDCLRSAMVPILNQKSCSKMYKYFKQGVQDHMVCAGYKNGGVDACKGDSGGPMACQIDGSYKLVGIVSWGHKCGEANNPGVFTRVQYFLDWIKKNAELQ